MVNEDDFFLLTRYRNCASTVLYLQAEGAGRKEPTNIRRYGILQTGNQHREDKGSAPCGEAALELKAQELIKYMFPYLVHAYYLLYNTSRCVYACGV